MTFDSLGRVGLEIPGVLEPAFEPLNSSESAVESRAWFEDPEWIGEIADSFEFSTLFKYKFRKGNHINVLESQVYLSWIKHCAKALFNHRVIGLLDSRVTIGAASKDFKGS